MRILVVGAKGQLGRDLVPVLVEGGHQVVDAGHDQLDITNLEAVRSVLAGVTFDRVVNCAAYTKVDEAERERELAFAVNRDGAGVVARACAEARVPLCHISTDFVFSQAPPRPPRPWTEGDWPEPRGVYALSKREGELAAVAAGGPLYLVRTSWLYGNRGPNFPLAILRAAAAGKALKVVSDQEGSPTWTFDLALRLARLLELESFGTYHLSSAGSTSWHGFAAALFSEVGLHSELTPVTTAEWAAPAPRPSYSVLANGAWEGLGEKPMPDWRVSLKRYVEKERSQAIAAAISSAGG
jgi:dTDP-4-dehydrorhamnose reductase